MILLLHHIRFIIYKRVLSSASLNTPSDLNKRVVKHAQRFKGPLRGETMYREHEILIKGCGVKVNAD